MSDPEAFIWKILPNFYPEPANDSDVRIVPPMKLIRVKPTANPEAMRRRNRYICQPEQTFSEDGAKLYNFRKTPAREMYLYKRKYPSIEGTAKPSISFEVATKDKHNTYCFRQAFCEEAMPSANSSPLSAIPPTEEYPHERSPKYENHEEAIASRKDMTKKQRDAWKFIQIISEKAISDAEIATLSMRSEAEKPLNETGIQKTDCQKESVVIPEVDMKEKQNFDDALSEEAVFGAKLSPMSGTSSKEDTNEAKPPSKSAYRKAQNVIRIEDMKEKQNLDAAFSEEAIFGATLSIMSDTSSKEDIDEVESHKSLSRNVQNVIRIEEDQAISRKSSDSGIQLYKCCSCYYSTPRRSRLMRHKLFIHTKNTCYECYICKFKSTYNHEYYIHMKLHFGNSPYVCQLCSYKTTVISSFVFHRITHTDEQIFKCHLCTFRCKRKYHLTQHANIHTTETQFQCTYCEKRYKYNSSLRKHLRSHMI